MGPPRRGGWRSAHSTSVAWRATPLRGRPCRLQAAAARRPPSLACRRAQPVRNISQNVVAFPSAARAALRNPAPDCWSSPQGAPRTSTVCEVALGSSESSGSSNSTIDAYGARRGCSFLQHASTPQIYLRYRRSGCDARARDDTRSTPNGGVAWWCY